jgi:hypothetical protein
MTRIAPSETVLTGRWISDNKGQLVADETCRRIQTLIGNHLEALGTDASGWDALYRDPADKRLWELIYPQSELSGGGPPELRHVSLSEARQKYGIAIAGL